MEEINDNIEVFDEEVLLTEAPQKDTQAPIINIKKKTYTITSGDNIDFLNGLTAYDYVDGDVTFNIKNNIESIDFKKEGVKKVEYYVYDSSGNEAKEIVYVTVKKDNTNIIKFGQLSILLALLIILIFFDKYIRSLKLEKRFSKYTIKSEKNKSVSLFDSLSLQYLDFIDKISKFISKSSLFKRISKRYEKYVITLNLNNAFQFIAKKIVCGFIFVIFVIIVGFINSRLSSPLEMLISFIVGFYLLDIVYFYRFTKYKKKISNDMLDAIMLMNNGFKSGLSITQAVDLVSREGYGSISKEFGRISKDISMGLDIEVAFKRFSDRVKTDEAIYLASSLSVLSKTGGNIIKVFDTIEKNMFSRKKLQNEFKSLTASSRLIMYVLLIVPPAFIAFISLINKDYFEPLFTNFLGIVLIFLMVIIYITYIIVVKKVLKVRGIR